MAYAAELISDRELGFTNRHFEFLRKMVGEHAGINLSEAGRTAAAGGRACASGPPVVPPAKSLTASR